MRSSQSSLTKKQDSVKMNAFELVEAERGDIPRLAQIHVIACLPDNAFSLYFPTAEEFEKRVVDILEGQVGDPSCKHIKAMDKETNKLVAWASWETPTDDKIRARDVKIITNSSISGQGKGEFDFPGPPTVCTGGYRQVASEMDT